MTVSVKPLIQPAYLPVVSAAMYTANNVTAIIDAVTITNTGSVNAVFSVYIVQNSDAAGADNQFIKSRTLQPGGVYHCPELIGQALANGDYIAAICSVADTLAVRASGREIT